MDPTPVPGKRYKHFKGNEYEVLLIAEEADTKDTMVVYKCVKTGKVWTRELSSWLEPVRLPVAPGPVLTRFEPMEAA